MTVNDLIGWVPQELCEFECMMALFLSFSNMKNFKNCSFLGILYITIINVFFLQKLSEYPNKFSECLKRKAFFSIFLSAS